MSSIIYWNLMNLTVTLSKSNYLNAFKKRELGKRERLAIENKVWSPYMSVNYVHTFSVLLHGFENSFCIYIFSDLSFILPVLTLCIKQHDIKFGIFFNKRVQYWMMVHDISMCGFIPRNIRVDILNCWSIYVL